MENLPPRLKRLLEEVPLIVDDQPERELASQLYEEAREAGTLEPGETLSEFAEGLCGLHSGIALTERSVEHSGGLPTDIRLFRHGIVETAGGWEPGPEESEEDVDEVVYDEIAITLLHEIGHHFGLNEEELTELGYD